MRRSLDFVKPYLGNGTIVCLDDFIIIGALLIKESSGRFANSYSATTATRSSRGLIFAPVGKSFIARVS
jgi:hypothetical protein